MNRRKAMWGFTIVESLIFLSISGFIFIAAIAGYTSRQREAQFNQGVQDLRSRIQDVINDVGSGFYPDIPQKCHADATNGPVTFDSNPANSSDCVWLGKALQLGEAYYCNAGSASDSAACNNYATIPIVARRTITDTDGTKSLVTNFPEARPIALAACLTNGDVPNSTICNGSNGKPARPDLTARGELPGGIGVYRIYVRADQAGNQGPTPVLTGALAFTTSFNGTSDRVGRASGTHLLYVPSTTVASTEHSMTDAIATGLGTGIFSPPNGLTVCIIGLHNQRAAITIGVDSRRLDLQVQRNQNIDPGCS